MQKGNVKWFTPTKGYGFINPENDEKDVFVHISAVERGKSEGRVTLRIDLGRS